MAPHKQLTNFLKESVSKAKLPFRFAKLETPNTKYKESEDFLEEAASSRELISDADENTEDIVSHIKKKGGVFAFSPGRDRKEAWVKSGEEQPQAGKTDDAGDAKASGLRHLNRPWVTMTQAIGSLLGNRLGLFQASERKPRIEPGATEDFIDDLTMDEAIALLEAEIAQDLVPEIYPPKETGLARFKFVRQISEKLEEITKRRTMTITVENEVVRIVVFQGRDVVAWGVANPKKDPFRGLEMARTDDEYTSRMKGLLGELQFRRLRVVADLPFYVPLMRHIQVPKIPKKYMDSVVVSEVLETVPFTDQEVDIPWQFRRNNEGNDIYAVVVPKKAVDEHVKTLKGLNIQPNAAYTRSTGLAFAAGVSNAIIVHLTQGQAAVILVLEGTARAVNRVELDPAHLDDTLQAEIINQAIEQVEVYYQPDAKSSPEASLLPVLITGPLVEDSPLADSIAKSLPNEIMPFAPAITYPEHFVPHEYAVNIGLALGDMARSKQKNKLAPERKPTVNLLSARHMPRPWPVWPAATFVTMLMLGVMAFSMTSQVGSVELEAGTLEARLQNLERQERRMRLERGQATALEQRIIFTQQQQDDLLNQLAGLELDKNYLLQRAHWITAAAVTPNIRVNNVAQQGDGFGVSGVAFSYEDVLEYAANLRGSALFSSVKVVRVSGGGDTEKMTVGYNLKIAVSPDFGIEEESDSPDDEEIEGAPSSTPSPQE